MITLRFAIALVSIVSAVLRISECVDLHVEGGLFGNCQQQLVVEGEGTVNINLFDVADKSKSEIPVKKCNFSFVAGKSSLHLDASFKNKWKDVKNKLEDSSLVVLVSKHTAASTKTWSVLYNWNKYDMVKKPLLITARQIRLCFLPSGVKHLRYFKLTFTTTISEEKSRTGMIVGVTIAVVLCVGLCVGLAVYIIHRRNTRLAQLLCKLVG